MEVTLQTLESQGRKNMIVKQDFDTKEVTGFKIIQDLFEIQCQF
jgi:hypothetical protein